MGLHTTVNNSDKYECWLYYQLLFENFL